MLLLRHDTAKFSAVSKNTDRAREGNGNLRVFISSDIEGVSGITTWDDTDPVKDGFWYHYFKEQMTREVAAACEGAIEAGATEILVNDAHDAACNIIPSGLPKEKVKLNRGWAGDGLSMVAGIQNGYDVLMCTGYHSSAYSSGSPLSHTMTLQVDELLINGQRASEFIVHSYIAGMLGIPVAFVSGDAALCESAKSFIPNITAVPIVEGRGNSMTSFHPDLAVERMKEGAKAALSGDWQSCKVPMPDKFDVKLRYSTHAMANTKSMYPGAVRLDEKTIGFTATDYMDVIRFFHFVI